MTQYPEAINEKSAIITKVKCELLEKVLQAGGRTQIREKSVSTHAELKTCLLGHKTAEQYQRDAGRG